MFVKRQDKVMFMEGLSEEFNRMKGFTALSTNKNPVEYTRQYVDEDFETTDVVAISTSIDFEYDQRKDDVVHEKLIDIIDNEKLGNDALVDILQVDLTTDTGDGEVTATKRTFSVIPGTEGEDINAYTYSGTFRVKGERVEGTATTTDGWKTAIFVETPDIP